MKKLVKKKKLAASMEFEWKPKKSYKVKPNHRKSSKLRKKRGK